MHCKTQQIFPIIDRLVALKSGPMRLLNAWHEVFRPVEKVLLKPELLCYALDAAACSMVELLARMTNSQKRKDDTT